VKGGDQGRTNPLAQARRLDTTRRSRSTVEDAVTAVRPACVVAGLRAGWFPASTQEADGADPDAGARDDHPERPSSAASDALGDVAARGEAESQSTNAAGLLRSISSR